MNCQQYREIVSAHVDETLSAQEEVEARSHLDGCDQCARIFRWEVKAAKAIKQNLFAVEVDPAVRKRILQTLETQSKRSLLGWPLNPHGFAASLILILVVVATLLIPKSQPPADIFADIVAQHQRVIDRGVPASNDTAPQSTDSQLDLRPWGYRLLSQQTTQYAMVRGRTFLYARGGKDYVLAQEVKGGTLAAPAGSRAIEAAGKTFIAHTVEGINLIAWKDNGVLCILAAKLPHQGLLQIAERLAATI